MKMLTLSISESGGIIYINYDCQIDKMRNNSKNLVTKKDVLFNSFEKHNTNVCVCMRVS